MPSSSRWCPTPEQVMILEEMYRGGIRNPNASQIQKITAHLSLYGKVEGKNVFYWFQNHKARDRQKLRRKLISQQQHHPNLHHLLPYLEFPPPPPPQLSHYNPVGSPLQPQSGVNAWKDVDDHLLDQRCEMGKSVFTGSSYGSDWMMTMLDVGPTPLLPPCCNNKPLKTLELFPITSTGLNDKCNNSLHNSTSN